MNKYIMTFRKITFAAASCVAAYGAFCALPAWSASSSPHGAPVFEENAAPINATMVGPEPAAVSAKNEKWDTISVDGKALSAAPFYVGGIVARDFAILTSKRLIIARLESDNKVNVQWTSGQIYGATALSLAAHDTNGDGREEIFVNAWRASGFSSTMIDKAGGKYRVLVDNLPYFFSSSPGGALYAQKLVDGGKRVDGLVYKVTRDARDLRIDPAFTIEGEAPLGLFNLDADGDGVSENVGVDRNGALVVYNQEGKLLWKAENLGGGTKKTKAANGNKEAPLAVPPRVVAVKDPEGRSLLAVGYSQFQKGMFMGIGDKDTGFLRLVRVARKSCSVEKKYVSHDSWIGDLVDMGGGPLGREDLPGYISISEKDNLSIIYLPPDKTRDEGRESSVSSGEPVRQKKDPVGP